MLTREIGTRAAKVTGKHEGTSYLNQWSLNVRFQHVAGRTGIAALPLTDRSGKRRLGHHAHYG